MRKNMEDVINTVIKKSDPMNTYRNTLTHNRKIHILTKSTGNIYQDRPYILWAVKQVSVN